MPAPSSSSVQHARKALSVRLLELRDDAGLTGRALAARLGWSEAKVSRIGTARTAPSVEDVKAWCTACGAQEKAGDLVASLRAVNSMYVQWHRMERSGLKHAQESVLPLHERTLRFRSYSSWLVPGMIQTRAYTTAVLRAVQQSRVEVDDVEAAVAVCMQRQQSLHQGRQRFAFVVEESVLRSGIGGAEIMAAQLGHLLTVGALPTVSLGIVPMQPDRTRLPVEGFWIYDQAQVNVELVSGYLTITQPSEIRAYETAFADLAAQAVHGARARTLITAALSALG